MVLVQHYLFWVLLEFGPWISCIPFRSFVSVEITMSNFLVKALVESTIKYNGQKVYYRKLEIPLSQVLPQKKNCPATCLPKLLIFIIRFKSITNIKRGRLECLSIGWATEPSVPTLCRGRDADGCVHPGQTGIIPGDDAPPFFTEWR